jgi:hypothetical protein
VIFFLLLTFLLPSSMAKPRGLLPLPLSLLLLCLLCSAEALVPVPAADYEWLSNVTASFLRGCELTGVGGVKLFTPDASSSYGAQWTRDFTMALSSAPALFAGLGVNVSASVAYTFARIEPSGRVPDRVQADGESKFSPGGGGWPISLAWDNMPYAGLMLAAHAAYAGGAAAAAPFFCAWEPTAARALALVPLRGGLAFNDPAAPNCSFGFEDSVVLPGRQLTVSLLLYDAATQLSALAAATGCGNASQYAAVAATVAAAVDTLYDASSGLFLASDTLETVPDVFGSAYLVKLNLSTAARRASVGGFLASQWHASGSTIFQEGQVRHLPQPLVWKQCWQGCPTPGTYQNGAFWATPLDWVLPALELTGHLAEAQAVAAATLTSFRAGGVMECINRDLKYTGVRDYVASAANVLGVIRPE